MSTKRTMGLFLDAVKCANQQEKTIDVDVQPEDTKKVFLLPCEQKLLPVTVEVLYDRIASAEQKAFGKFMHTARVQVMQQGMELLAVYGKLKEADVPALVVKGCVCRAVWPKGDLRISADEDVYVRPEIFQKACDVLRECGLICDEKADPETDFRSDGAGRIARCTSSCIRSCFHRNPGRRWICSASLMTPLIGRKETIPNIV